VSPTQKTILFELEIIWDEMVLAYVRYCPNRRQRKPLVGIVGVEAEILSKKYEIEYYHHTKEHGVHLFISHFVFMIIVLIPHAHDLKLLFSMISFS
jgi:hypothetical protein